jgi:hypothetical protein
VFRKALTFMLFRTTALHGWKVMVRNVPSNYTKKKTLLAPYTLYKERASVSK